MLSGPTGRLLYCVTVQMLERDLWRKDQYLCANTYLPNIVMQKEAVYFKLVILSIFQAM